MTVSSHSLWECWQEVRSVSWLQGSLLPYTRTKNEGNASSTIMNRRKQNELHSNHDNCNYLSDHWMDLLDREKDKMNNDLISREALLNAMEEERQYLLARGQTGAEHILVHHCLPLIDNAPTVDVSGDEYFPYRTAFFNGVEAAKRGEWIPVSERLPEDMQRVLIWFEYYRYGDFNCMYQTYGFGYVCDGKWSPFINGETGWQDYRVIAWQPLPEPYKEGGAEL